jgi:hypothetical protein
MRKKNVTQDPSIFFFPMLCRTVIILSLLFVYVHGQVDKALCGIRVQLMRRDEKCPESYRRELA